MLKIKVTEDDIARIADGLVVYGAVIGTNDKELSDYQELWKRIGMVDDYTNCVTRVKDVMQRQHIWLNRFL
jgi:hypothetical protein